MNGTQQTQKHASMRLKDLQENQSILLRPDFTEGLRSFALWDYQNNKRYSEGEVVDLPSGQTTVSPFYRLTEGDKVQFRRMDSYTRKGFVLPNNENMYINYVPPGAEQRMTELWSPLTPEQQGNYFLKITKFVQGNRSSYGVELTDGQGAPVQNAFTPVSPTPSAQIPNGQAIVPDLTLPTQEDQTAPPVTFELNDTEKAYVDALQKNAQFSPEQRLSILTARAKLTVERAQEILNQFFPN